MTANELMGHQVDELGYQLGKVFEGIPSEQHGFRSCPTAMSPRETLEHLIEAYEAFEASSRGEEYAWGSLKTGHLDWDGLVGLFETTRNAAATRAKSSESEKELKAAHDYMVGHDGYHVGQMSASRIAMDSGWDPYCIYRHQ